MAQADNCPLMLLEKKSSGAISGLLIFLWLLSNCAISLKACQQEKKKAHHTHESAEEFSVFCKSRAMEERTRPLIKTLFQPDLGYSHNDTWMNGDATWHISISRWYLTGCDLSGNVAYTGDLMAWVPSEAAEGKWQNFVPFHASVELRIVQMSSCISYLAALLIDWRYILRGPGYGSLHTVRCRLNDCFFFLKSPCKRAGNEQVRNPTWDSENNLLILVTHTVHLDG